MSASISTVAHAATVVVPLSTRAADTRIDAAACSLHLELTTFDGHRRPIDVRVGERRCAFGLVPADAVTLQVLRRGDQVVVEQDAPADVAPHDIVAIAHRAADIIDWRLVETARDTSNTFYVLPQSPRSATLYHLGLLSTGLGGAAMLASAFSAFGIAAANTLRFCFNFDGKPCPPVDTTDFVTAAASFFVSGVVLLTFGIAGMVIGNRHVVSTTARFSPTGSGLRFTF